MGVFYNVNVKLRGRRAFAASRSNAGLGVNLVWDNGPTEAKRLAPSATITSDTEARTNNETFLIFIITLPFLPRQRLGSDVVNTRFFKYAKTTNSKKDTEDKASKGGVEPSPLPVNPNQLPFFHKAQRKVEGRRAFAAPLERRVMPSFRTQRHG